jgi:hypothetical protein
MGLLLPGLSIEVVIYCDIYLPLFFVRLYFLRWLKSFIFIDLCMY